MRARGRLEEKRAATKAWEDWLGEELEVWLMRAERRWRVRDR